MSKGSKKHVKFTFHSLIRLILFSLIMFLVVIFVSKQKSGVSQTLDPTTLIGEEQSNLILGKTTEISNNLYQQIPPKSRQQLENLNQSPAIIFIQDKINQIKEESKDFPQKQIKEIQKIVVKNIYENTIRNIDSQ